MNQTTPPARIAIIGSGAVGCYYGGRLAQHGNDVHFLMRRDLNHVLAHGLTIHSVHGDFQLPNVQAHGDTQSIGPSDLVIITLKATDNKALLDLIPPLLKPDTMLLTLQNGLGIEPWLAEHFGSARVLGGLCFVCINRTSPGVIEHYSQGAVTLGEYERPPQPRSESLASEWQRCGIECVVAPDLLQARWRKLVWNIPFNGLAIAAGGIDVGQILANPGHRAQAIALMEEVIAIAKTLGHPLPEDLLADQLARTEQMGPYKPSSLIDYHAGRPVELEAIWGEPLRQGQHAGACVEQL